jgi:hypothetical protein
LRAQADYGLALVRILSGFRGFDAIVQDDRLSAAFTLAKDVGHGDLVPDYTLRDAKLFTQLAT